MRKRVMKDFKLFRKYWRAYGASPILILQVISYMLWGDVAMSYVLLLFLTVPCRIKIINTNRYLWIGRQLLILGVALSIILSSNNY